MKTTQIAAIKIGDRQRKAFDEDTLEELALSIQTKGLLHPVVLMSRKSKSKPFILVAGERRLRAMNLLYC